MMKIIQIFSLYISNFCILNNKKMAKKNKVEKVLWDSGTPCSSIDAVSPCPSDKWGAG